MDCVLDGTVFWIVGRAHCLQEAVLLAIQSVFHTHLDDLSNLYLICNHQQTPAHSGEVSGTRSSQHRYQLGKHSGH